MTLLWKKDGFLTIAAYTSDAALEEKSFLTMSAYTIDAALEERQLSVSSSDAALKELSDYGGLH